MITLRDKETGTILGEIPEDDFLFLAERLERESPDDTDYYINNDLLDALAGQGMPASLHDLLRQALGNRDGMEVEWLGEGIEADLSDPIRSRVARLSDDELVKMILDEPDQYRPDALAVAKAEAAKRNLSLEDVPRPLEGEETASLASALLGSLKVGARKAVASEEPSTYQAGGLAVSCTHCKNNQFYLHKVLLNTRGLTFFKLDWLNRGATVLVCANCGMIQWFSETPE
jgi:uncharacterized protein